MTQTWLEPFCIPSFSSTCQSSTELIFIPQVLPLSQGLFSPQTELMTLAALLAPTEADVFFTSPTPLLMLAHLSRTSALACGLTPACYLASM